MNDNKFTDIMNIVLSSLEDRGYDPYTQLLGYITEGQPNYITSHNNARMLIQTLDFEQVKKYVLEMEKNPL